ncbi:monocarboxylate transporter 12-like [Amphiura filiformis]|uniref:monocarboxylate transporter 12-like n=1 Tax=Amphiura filiformis TaxID=82378 RepID=UPI003B20B983
MTGWGCLLGMFASYLKSRFGVRLCIMFCGLVSSTGLIVCAYATNVYLLLLGIILTGFMYLQENIALGIVPEYFDKYYNLAVNIYGFGSGLAVVVYPLLVQMAQDHYGWHGALLLLGALTTHSLIFGALIKHNKAEKSLSIPLIRDNPQGEIDKTNFILNLKFLTSILKRCDANLLTDPSFIFRVVLPGIANGYTVSGWLIYIVSFALSVGATRAEASLVATTGGIGLMIIRIALPFLNSIMTYRQLLYASSITMAASLALMTLFQSIPMLSVMSMIFCLGTGTLTTEIYIAARDVTEDDQYINAVSWFHLSFGFSMIAGGTLSGK